MNTEEKKQTNKKLPNWRCLTWRFALHASTYSSATHVFNEFSHAAPGGQVNLIRKL